MNDWKRYEARRGNRWVAWGGRGATKRQVIAWAENYVLTNSVRGFPLSIVDNVTREIIWKENQ